MVLCRSESENWYSRFVFMVGHMGSAQFSLEGHQIKWNVTKLYKSLVFNQWVYSAKQVPSFPYAFSQCVEQHAFSVWHDMDNMDTGTVAPCHTPTSHDSWVSS